jgi:putative DNA primase/helicase
MTARAVLRDAQHANSNGAGPNGATIVLPPPSVPMDVAREFARVKFLHADDSPTLRHWRGGFWHWKTSRWVEIEQRVVRAWAYEFTEHATYERRDKKGEIEIVGWAPNRSKVADLLQAFEATAHLPDTVAQPTWIGVPDAPDDLIVACANGLLDVGERTLLDHDPRFFNQTAVPFAYDAKAPQPKQWLEFLQALWPEDPSSIAALQEWFGYIISGRLDLHKILLLVGPTRGGKGAIARVLGALVGRENVAGPTLSSLGTGFGLSTLIGKPLAVISDARLPTGRSSQTVVERLLAISGEDTIDVDRKYRDPWTGKLPSRFMVISNELPKLGDASAAIAGRFVPLQLSRSWLGKEDRELETRLHAELTGILNWSLDGLKRLTKNDHFTRPESTEEAMDTLMDLASPAGAFVRDCCEQGEHETNFDEMWKAWKDWAEDNNHSRGTKQTFGKDLRAAVPSIRVKRPRAEGEKRKTIYWGIKPS